MSNVIESIERAQLRKVPRFKAGDTVRVHFQVIEGTRRRVQVFEGIVIKRQGSGARETFTVRKQSFGVGVERTFPLHSPKIEKIEVQAIGDVNRAKLYYLRGRVGKKARVRERALRRTARRRARERRRRGAARTTVAGGRGGRRRRPRPRPSSVRKRRGAEPDGSTGEAEPPSAGSRPRSAGGRAPAAEPPSPREPNSRRLTPALVLGRA